MDHRDIARQTLIEQQMLTHITQAIRTTLAWSPVERDCARKLSSLRFVTASLERHLDRLMNLEERDGYMAAALESCPNLSCKIDSLKREHVQFSDTLHRILPGLAQASATDRERLDAICAELGTLLGQLDEHTRREGDLLQEALLRDEGGEG